MFRGRPAPCRALAAKRKCHPYHHQRGGVSKRNFSLPVLTNAVTMLPTSLNFPRPVSQRVGEGNQVVSKVPLNCRSVKHWGNSLPGGRFKPFTLPKASSPDNPGGFPDSSLSRARVMGWVKLLGESIRLSRLPNLDLPSSGGLARSVVAGRHVGPIGQQ